MNYATCGDCPKDRWLIVDLRKAVVRRRALFSQTESGLTYSNNRLRLVVRKLLPDVLILVQDTSMASQM